MAGRTRTQQLFHGSEACGIYQNNTDTKAALKREDI